MKHVKELNKVEKNIKSLSAIRMNLGKCSWDHAYLAVNLECMNLIKLLDRVLTHNYKTRTYLSYGMTDVEIENLDLDIPIVLRKRLDRFLYACEVLDNNKKAC